MICVELLPSTVEVVKEIDLIVQVSYIKDKILSTVKTT